MVEIDFYEVKEINNCKKKNSVGLSSPKNKYITPQVCSPIHEQMTLSTIRLRLDETRVIDFAHLE